MDDCINRQEAIDRIESIRPANPKQSDYTHGIDVGIAMCIMALREQSFAEPELAEFERMKLVQEAVNVLMDTSKSDSIKDKCFRNAARFVQNAIDGKYQKFEQIPYEPEWMPCTPKTMPDMPEENPEFDNKPIEIYLVTVADDKYPFRAFWNGKFFTDGWSKVDALAYMPLPKPYHPKEDA